MNPIYSSSPSLPYLSGNNNEKKHKHITYTLTDIELKIIIRDLGGKLQSEPSDSKCWSSY